MDMKNEFYADVSASANPAQNQEIEPTKQTTGKSGGSGKANLSSLFALLSSLALGLAAAFSIQRIFWVRYTFLPFVLVALVIGLGLLAVSIVFGVGAKKADQNVKVGFVSNKVVCAILSILTAIAAVLIFFCLLCYDIFRDNYAFEAFFGLKAIAYGKIAGFIAYEKFADTDRYDIIGDSENGIRK